MSDKNTRPEARLEPVVGPAPSKPTQSEQVHRRRGEVCALGRALRDAEKAPDGALAVLRKHYAKARRTLKNVHQQPRR